LIYTVCLWLGFFSLFGCVPLVRQRPEVVLFGFVSTRCIASEVLIKASFIKKKNMNDPDEGDS
jgi:hypothetical protein